MTKLLPFSLLAGAALAAGGMAYAQTPAAKPTTATHAAVTKKTTTTTSAAAKPATTPAATNKTTTRTAASGAGGRMVSTKTSTGKTITYNCSKAGNASKKACKG